MWKRSFEFETNSNLKIYCKDEWNDLDAGGCLLFSIGMGLRILAYFIESEELFIAAR